ncbi:MAG: PQQ-dependent sugar dehydrogenase [Halobacteriota archaeon]
MFERYSRRALLAMAGAGIGTPALAGCSGTDEPNDTDRPGDPTDAPDGTPTSADGDAYDLSVDHDRQSWDRYDPDWRAPTSAPTGVSIEREILVENLELPWDLAFAPNGDLFISERTGRILKYSAEELDAVAAPDDVIDSSSAEPGDTEHDWWASGTEGGLMGLAVHPNYPAVPIVYAFYTYDGDDGERNRLVYYDVSAADPNETMTILIDDIPGDTVHNGSRIAFGPENYLWVTMGDANDEATRVARNDDAEPAYQPLPQDTSSLVGKVLRIEPNGDPAADNPDLGDGSDPRIYSYGHRNPQGISWLPDGTPIVTEHGPSGRDEVQLLRPGGNYGWPDARNAEEYPGTAFDRPVVNTGPGDTWAPSGCVFYTGDAVPEWRHRLLVGTLRGEHVNVTTLFRSEWDRPADAGGSLYDAEWMHEEWHATSHRFFEGEFGRIRHVEQGPDGQLYAITSNRDGRSEGPFPTARDDVLMRLVPERD